MTVGEKSVNPLRDEASLKRSGEKSVNPLPDGTSSTKWENPLPDGTSSTKWEPEKKDLLRGSFFSYRPSAGAAPRSVPTQQSVYVVAPTLQLLTISLAKPFLSNTT